MNEDFSSYSQAAVYTDRMMMVDQQVALRVISLQPARQSAPYPIVFVTNLSTRIDSFQEMLWELTKGFPVHIIETREKASSQIRGKVRFDMETNRRSHSAEMGQVIREFVEHTALAGYGVTSTGRMP